MKIIDSPSASPTAFISTSHRTLSGRIRWDTSEDIRYRRACEAWAAEYPYTINVSLTFARRSFDDLRHVEPGDLDARRSRSRTQEADRCRGQRKQGGPLTVSQVEELMTLFCRRLGARTGQSIRTVFAIETHQSGHLHVHGVIAGVHLTPDDVVKYWPYGREPQASWLGDGHQAARGVSYNFKNVDARNEEETSGRVCVFGKGWSRPDYHACLEVVRVHDPKRAEGLPTWDERCARQES